MLASLMVYSVVAGATLLLAACAGEAMLGVLRLPRRWAWVFCLGALIVLTVGAPLRSALSVRASSPAARVDDLPVVGLPVLPEPSLSSLGDLVERIVNAPMTFVLDHSVAGGVDTILVAAWAIGSMALLAGLLVSVTRSDRRRRSWPLHRVAGTEVRISRDTGPAVLGILRPEIVLPSWLLDRPEAEQYMIVAHERAHLDTRDPILLLLGCVAVVLLPWNVFAWWLSRRLRLAIELDCDTRVLRNSTSSVPYAQLLVATAQRRSTLRFLSPALADSTSDLERRLQAMNRNLPSHPALRATAAAAAAALLVLAACEADLPTSAELDAMSAAEMVEAAAPLAAVEDAVYIVDGVRTDAATALMIAPEKIATVDIRKGAAASAEPGGQSVVEIRTLQPLMKQHAGAMSASTAVSAAAGGFDGLLLIDGRRVDAGVLREIDPETIESIEVVKGAAAARLYDAPEARNGVISIRTKTGSN